MSEPAPDRSLLAQAWDIARYAPIGLVMEGPSLLPMLAEKGKVHARNARVVGELAVREGRQRLDGVDGQARDLLQTLGIVPGDRSNPTAPAAEQGDRPSRPAPPAPTPETGVDTSDRVVPAAADLAIEDYESLSASQVVSRLAGLTPDELDAVHAFEAGRRGRRTILNRIAQLR